MKVYKVVVKDVYLVEANSPKEAESKFDAKHCLDWKDVHLDHYKQSKPIKVADHPFWKESV
tara:strand:- start:285 stop:467 length:183 start_codon:yes stop_codon:yes gene_type:complete